jgi:hypothetical protein
LIRIKKGWPKSKKKPSNSITEQIKVMDGNGLKKGIRKLVIFPHPHHLPQIYRRALRGNLR